MSARVGIVVFPGTNCELDVAWAVEHLGGEPRMLWHGDRRVGDVDAVIVPGGFAHGDYLRAGAIARFSPIMEAVAEFAAANGPVVGICNGFWQGSRKYGNDKCSEWTMWEALAG